MPLERLKKMCDQFSGRAEFVSEALTNPTSAVLMVPAVIDCGAVIGVRIVVAEYPVPMFVLQDEGVIEAMRLLLRRIDQIGTYDHLPATFHNVNAGVIDQELKVGMLEHISPTDIHCYRHVKNCDSMVRGHGRSRHGRKVPAPQGNGVNYSNPDEWSWD